MKRYFIANWKMYLSISKSEQLARQLVRLEKQKKLPKDVEVIIAPSLLALQSVAAILKKAKSKMKELRTRDHIPEAYRRVNSRSWG
jgi:triosephosphate isomerase